MISIILRSYSIDPSTIREVKALLQPYIRVMKEFETTDELYDWLYRVCPFHRRHIDKIKIFDLSPWVQRPRQNTVRREIQRFLGYITLDVYHELQSAPHLNVTQIVSKSIFLRHLFG